MQQAVVGELQDGRRMCCPGSGRSARRAERPMRRCAAGLRGGSVCRKCHGRVAKRARSSSGYHSVELGSSLRPPAAGKRVGCAAELMRTVHHLGRSERPRVGPRDARRSAKATCPPPARGARPAPTSSTGSIRPTHARLERLLLVRASSACSRCSRSSLTSGAMLAPPAAGVPGRGEYLKV